MTIKTKRVYEAPAPGDGTRILVDRMWPRGVSRERAAVDAWMKTLAPSDELRKWFSHRPERWETFRKRYADEFASRQKEALEMLNSAATGVITLVYSARDTRHNQAVALKTMLEELLDSTPS